MILRTPALVFSSCPHLIASPTSCITSSSCGWQRPRHYNRNSECVSCQPSSSLRTSPHTRSYASVSDSRKKSDPSATGDYQWPMVPHPTPYDIFAQPRHARYNKAIFYELVKIYHPDRVHVSVNSAVSPAVRLERYRLIVAANEILSDPVKRKAYDLYGAGWDSNRSMQSLYREADKRWRSEPGNPSMNATWEDWDRWYREKNGEKPPQTPMYMSNELFVVLLCAFVVAGSMAQARRANSNTMSIVEMREQSSVAINGDMRRRQNEQALLNRHERVENFLRQRDGWNIASSTANDPTHDEAQHK
ncbi:hypothetical protein GGR57DRAFT_184458 [Xylariaceae sp. FL1272]|nr:hypothetical protein GGR57DRAFT_184458 [Xylariaceae sp. FL1272]